MKKNIAILYGGDSSEYEISLKSGQQVATILDTEKYNAFLVHVKGSFWSLTTEPYQGISIHKDDFSFHYNNQKIQFDFALIAIHGTPGENGVLQGYFDIMGIPYSSSNLITSAITFNKYACKLYLKDIHVDTAKAVMIRRNDPIRHEKIMEKVGLPCFVKPNNGGSSYGITKVKEAGKLKEAIEKAFEVDTEVIIEEFIAGTEITQGVFKSRKKEIIFPITEIVPKNEYFDVNAKYFGDSNEITPARISDELTENCNILSSAIYNALGCKGICRIDYIISGNRLVFLEINTVPGMTSESIIPQQAKYLGISMTELFNILIEDCTIKE